MSGWDRYETVRLNTNQLTKPKIYALSPKQKKFGHHSKPLCRNMGFPDGSDGKGSTCNVGDLDSFPGLGRFPGEGHGNPLQYSCLENPHRQRSLADYSLCGLKELDTTEWVSTAQHMWNIKMCPAWVVRNTLAIQN